MTTVTPTNSVPVKNLKRITAYVLPDVYDILESWAEEDSRTLSNLVGVIVTKAAQERKQEKQTDSKEAK